VRTLVFGITLAIIALTNVACGGGSACGDNHKDSDEQCDDGNDRDDDACSNSCKVQNTNDVSVQWRILGDAVPGFVESCDGIGAITAHIVLDGPIPAEVDVECSYSQYVLAALRPGDYTVTITLYDAAMPTPAAVTLGTQAQFTVTEGDMTVPLVIPWEDLATTNLRGDWFYRFKWAGATTCAAAVPPVDSVRIRLTQNGQPVADEQGNLIDGTDEIPCYDFDDAFAHAVNRLPFGPATLTVQGTNAGGQVNFEGTFDTFIGAGIQNPALLYDVPQAGG
jgi:cysteine-rich repeat protein